MTLKIDDFVFLEGSLASGILQIGDGGLAGKILLQSEAVDPLAGLGIEGLSFSTDTRFDLLLNTTLSIEVGQATLLDLAANGFLKLDGSGVAGKVLLQLLSEIPADDPRRWGA